MLHVFTALYKGWDSAIEDQLKFIQYKLGTGVAHLVH